jgi:1,4-dihydroxy-2-naphthoyl-CoA hydrolase
MDVLAMINAANKNTLVEHLGIEVIKAEEGYLEATMPVDHRTVQPMRLLHGGATAALAETLGSIGSVMLVDREKEAVVGLELNINHLRSATSGKVLGKAKAIHKGRKTHVWQIDVFDEKNKQVSSGRLTVMVIDQSL